MIPLTLADGRHLIQAAQAPGPRANPPSDALTHPAEPAAGAAAVGAGEGLLTTWALLWRRLRVEFWAIRASLWTGHTIICWLGRKGLQIVRSLRHGQPNARIVAIYPHPDPVLAEEADVDRVHLILDDATDPHALAQARVEHAGEIITLTPSASASSTARPNCGGIHLPAPLLSGQRRTPGVSH